MFVKFDAHQKESLVPSPELPLFWTNQAADVAARECARKVRVKEEVRARYALTFDEVSRAGLYVGRLLADVQRWRPEGFGEAPVGAVAGLRPRVPLTPEEVVYKHQLVRASSG